MKIRHIIADLIADLIGIIAICGGGYAALVIAHGLGL